MAVCPKCNESSVAGVLTCSKCGTVLPEALEKMIDDRAHAIVERDKAANAEAEDRAAQKLVEKKEREKLDEDLKAASAAYDENMTEPPTLGGSIVSSMIGVAIVAFILGLLPFGGGVTTYVLYPVIGYTPASVFCPWVCDGCERSARVVRSRSGKSHIFLCKNTTVDVTKIAYDDADQDAMRPYQLSGNGARNPHFGWYTTVILETLVVTPCLALVLGPIFGIRRRKRRLAMRPDLKAKRDALLERVRLLDAEKPEAPPYR
jgi:hypothetical protein